LTRRTIIFLAVASLLTVSGMASAQNDDSKEDTVFNYGYDEESHVFLWNATPNDGLYDCSLAGAPVKATYGLTSDGLIEVEGLTDFTDVVVSFPARPQADLAEGLIEAGGPVDYTGPDGECGVGGGLVDGPNGQVNHGMFMKLFNSLYEGKGRGCLNRFLARSDLGKGEQQVTVPEADDLMTVVDGQVGVLDFFTADADCEHGQGKNGADVEPEHSSKPEKPGKPDHPGKPDSPGNSDK
jgi:hypothetical protein